MRFLAPRLNEVLTGAGQRPSVILYGGGLEVETCHKIMIRAGGAAKSIHFINNIFLYITNLDFFLIN